MARWKLMTSHYLNTVEPVEWEYNEVARSNGRAKRMRITVPRYLDIGDPGDWTNSWAAGTNMSTAKLNNEEGEIIVCLPGRGQKGDIEFLGDPTPDMSPIDDEAKELSASFFDRWRWKPDGEVNHSQSLVDGLHDKMAEAQSRPQTVQVEGLPELVAAMAQQSQAIAALLSQSTRRV
jgi:hypothetical protein